MENPDLYYKQQRLELIQHIQPGQNHVLDVGCAEGILGESLKQRGLASEVIGIEKHAAAAAIAKKRLDHVICGDIENINRRLNELAPKSFDYIICGDIIEHLRNPWALVEWLVTLLKDNGELITSVPNIRHWSVSFPLLFRGSWKYQPHGILDKTHLRFFTKNSLIDLLEDAGVEIKLLQPIMYRKIDKIGNKITLGMLNEIFSFQWLVIAKK